jgi:short-subunit dehydrogenase
LDKLLDAKAHLTSSIPPFQGDVDTYDCDISDTERVERLWDDLQQREVVVDVMILNAACIGAPQTLFERGWRHLWMHYEMNVRANMVFTDWFVKRAAETHYSKV